MRCRQHEVVIGGEQHKIVSNTKVRNERVDGAQLHAGPAAQIAEICSTYIVLPLRCQQGKGGKSLYDIGSCARASKALQQLLEYQAGSYDRLAAGQGGTERTYMSIVPDAIASERQ